MTSPTSLFHLGSDALALLTDLYELTMACGYGRAGLSDREGAFHVQFRSHPFGGGFTIAAGLADAIRYLSELHFRPDDLAYLGQLTGNDGRPLFDVAFLDHLAEMRVACDVDAVPEGTVVFPHEPLVRVVGPLDQAQIAETALLNLINFQTLIATKAARICLAAEGDSVIEFGLRRAQGINGGLAATRAAFIGGCDSTSNVLAGKELGIPVKGTHAHSWVMAFPDEPTALQAYAAAMPNNCILLVDTYDAIEGVRRAIEVGRWLRERGHTLAGIRLDSGDLAYLSQEARRLLDAAGFPETAILASNDLDEHVIASLKQQRAAISVWGVGTRLVTGHDQPSLGGVYKLSATREAGGPWQETMKLSEQLAKISLPGVLNVQRFRENGRLVGDMIFDETHPSAHDSARVLVDPANPLRRKTISGTASAETLLVPIFRAGKLVFDAPPLAESRARTLLQLKLLHPGIKRLLNPHEYPAGLEVGLHARRAELIERLRTRSD